MRITRDSLLLYLAFVGTLAAYFAAAENTPDLWSFKDWMQFVIVIVAWVTGKLQTSPLPHSVEGGAKVTPSGQ